MLLTGSSVPGYHRISRASLHRYETPFTATDTAFRPRRPPFHRLHDTYRITKESRKTNIPVGSVRMLLLLRFQWVCVAGGHRRDTIRATHACMLSWLRPERVRKAFCFVCHGIGMVARGKNEPTVHETAAGARRPATECVTTLAIDVQ